MKNFRKTFKNFGEKTFNKIMYGEPLCCDYFSLAIKTLPFIILTIVITVFVTRAVTINAYKDAQRDAMFNSMTEQMTECKTRATVPEQCTYEVTYEHSIAGDIITNIEVTYHGL